MRKTKINVLREGDTVIMATMRGVTIQRKTGEVDLIWFGYDNGILSLEKSDVMTIGYGNGTTETVIYGDDDELLMASFY